MAAGLAPRWISAGGGLSSLSFDVLPAPGRWRFDRLFDHAMQLLPCCRRFVVLLNGDCRLWQGGATCWPQFGALRHAAPGDD